MTRVTESRTDHRPVRAKMKLRIKRQIRYNWTRISKCIDVSKLKDPAISKDLQIAFADIEFDGTWDQFKIKAYNTSVEVLGLRKKNIGIGLMNTTLG